MTRPDEEQKRRKRLFVQNEPSLNSRALSRILRRYETAIDGSNSFEDKACSLRQTVPVSTRFKIHVFINKIKSGFILPTVRLCINALKFYGETFNSTF